MMKQCRRICIGAATGIHLLYQRCWRSCTTSRKRLSDFPNHSRSLYFFACDVLRTRWLLRKDLVVCANSFHSLYRCSRWRARS